MVFRCYYSRQRSVRPLRFCCNSWTIPTWDICLSLLYFGKKTTKFGNSCCSVTDFSLRPFLSQKLLLFFFNFFSLIFHPPPSFLQEAAWRERERERRKRERREREKRQIVAAFKGGGFEDTFDKRLLRGCFNLLLQWKEEKWRRRLPNQQQRTLSKLPPELRCKIFVDKRRLSTQVGAKHVKNLHATCAIFRLSFHFACHHCWLG